MNAFHFFRPVAFQMGMRERSLRILLCRLCPSPFIWFCVASWLASVASASAAADTEVLRLRASRSASSIGSFSSASPRRQTAIYRFGSSALLPKGVDGPEIASIDAPENQQAEDEAVDAVDTVEKSLPAGTMILLGLASLIFPMIVYICPRLRKSDTIPLHQGYAAVPRSEVIGHGADFPHGAPLTNSTIHLPPAQSAQGTQFFYIGEENATDATENADADEPQAMVGYTSALEAPPTESEPEAELCPESNVPSPSHGSGQSDHSACGCDTSKTCSTHPTVISQCSQFCAPRSISARRCKRLHTLPNADALCFSTLSD